MPCQITFPSLDVVQTGTLRPQQVIVRGVVGCASGVATSVTVTTSVSPAPVTLVPGPGGQFSTTLPVNGSAKCGDKIQYSIEGHCADGSTCRFDGDVDLNCGSCARAELTSSAAPCIAGLQPITLNATIAIPAGASYQFQWVSGITGTPPSAVFPINNAAGTANTLHAAAPATFNYAPGNYTARLVQVAPAAGECPVLEIALLAQCIICPAATGSVSVGPCDANLRRAVTFEVAFSPPVPAGATASVTYLYGGANVAGATSAVVTLATTAAVNAAPPHTALFAPQASAFFASAVVNVAHQGQVCPPIALNFNSTPGGMPPGVWLESCQVCPQDVPVQVSTPANWCVPVGGAASGTATLHAEVVWPPGTTLHPNPSLYDWTVTLPDGRTAKRNNVPASAIGQCDVPSNSGWTGTGSAAGGIALANVGIYAVSAVAKFPPSAGLPAGPDGTPLCNLSGSSSFTLNLCNPVVDPPCPAIRIVALNADCADPAAGKAATMNFAAQVNDPAGIGQGIEWDFGDPGSPGNMIVMPPGMTTASHSYAAAGSYPVTARVRHSGPCRPVNGPDTATLALVVTTCPCPAGQVRDASGRCVAPPPPTTPPPPPMSVGCWILLIAALVLGVLACVLGIVAACQGNVYLGIAAGAIALVALVLLALWLGFCAAGNCPIFNWLRWITIWILMIAPIVGLIVGIATGGVPCGVIATLILWGYWGLVLAILDIAGPRIPCPLLPPPFP